MVAATVALERLPGTVRAVSVGLDDQPLAAPEEVHPQRRAEGVDPTMDSVEAASFSATLDGSTRQTESDHLLERYDSVLTPHQRRDRPIQLRLGKKANLVFAFLPSLGHPPIMRRKT